MTPSARAVAAARTRPSLHPADPPEDDAEPLGPGWYESSWDLLTGLDVCEAPWTEAWAAAGRLAA